MLFNFIVEIDGISVAGFSEVSGLSVETQVERKTFGGENHKEFVFLGPTKYSDLTLKKTGLRMMNICGTGIRMW
ncbi:phage tail protein [Paenibacillus rhizoplanae]